jgi:hypothetical protein
MRTLKHAEVVKISRMIEKVFVQLDGVWTWLADYNDERLSIESKLDGVTGEHVKRLRRAAFGEAPKQSKARKLEAAIARIEILEDKVATLMSAAKAAPQPAQSKPTLSINRSGGGGSQPSRLVAASA